MKKKLGALILILISISSLSLGQTKDTTEIVLPQGAAKRGDYETIFNPRRNLGQMSKAQEEFLLKLHSNPVKDKLNELKKLNKQKYYEMLWDLPVPISANTPKNAPLDNMVVYNGPEPLERTQINVLEIEIEILTQRYRNADETSKRDIENKLRTDLNEYFGIRASRIQNRVNDAESKLNELKNKFGSVKNNKSQIINRRLEELLHEKTN